MDFTAKANRIGDVLLNVPVREGVVGIRRGYDKCGVRMWKACSSTGCDASGVCCNPKFSNICCEVSGNGAVPFKVYPSGGIALVRLKGYRVLATPT